MSYYKNIFSKDHCPPKETFDQYISGTLTDKEEYILEKHLLDCPKCAEVLEGMLSYETPGTFDLDLAVIQRNLFGNSISKKVVWYVAAASSGLLLLGSYLFLHQPWQKDPIAENTIVEEKKNQERLTLEKNRDTISISTPALEAPSPIAHHGGNLANKGQGWASDSIKDNTYTAMQDSSSTSQPASSEKLIAMREEATENKETSKGKVEEVKIIDIEMQEDTFVLGDVVVIGYGTQNKTSVTGAISSVLPKDLKRKSKDEKESRIIHDALKSVNEYVRKGNKDSALAAIHDLASRYPDFEKIRWIQAEVFIVNNKKAEAIQLLKELSVTGKKYKRRSLKKLDQLEHGID